jgi:hypothetical protein
LGIVDNYDKVLIEWEATNFEAISAGGYEQTNFHIYGTWEEQAETIDLFYNVGSYTGGDAPSTISNSTSFTITSEMIPTLEKADHRFGGWFYNYDEEADEIYSNPVQIGDTISQDTTVYATWLPNMITINYLDSDGETSLFPSETINYNDQFIFPAPTRDGSIFTGWVLEFMPGILEITVNESLMGEVFEDPTIEAGQVFDLKASWVNLYNAIKSEKTTINAEGPQTYSVTKLYEDINGNSIYIAIYYDGYDFQAK